MKTNLDSPLSYFIIGLPRSGTTIVASLFNSLDDGFCLGEPHWYLETRRINCDEIRNFTGKVTGQFDCKTITDKMDVMPRIVMPLLGEYNLCGYKETYRGDVLGKRLLREHIPLVNFFVIVLRHPDEVHASQQRVEWPVKEWGLNKAFDDHSYLTNLSRRRKAVTIWYDHFCHDPIAAVNGALLGMFKIEGEFILKPTGWIYGDPCANKSTRVEKIDHEK